VEELDQPSDDDVDGAWLNEVIRRSRELDEGVVKAIPADEVFHKARAELKQ
jgi:hypothetical protein